MFVASVIIGTACLVLGPLLRRRSLLSWYVRETRRMPLAEAPGEAIVTYPLA